MRFYTQQHQHYCGIDLHARTMYLCILNQTGEVLLHRNLRATPEAFLQAITPYREELVVAVECMFTWLDRAPADQRVSLGMQNRIHRQVNIENGPEKVMGTRSLDGGQCLDRGTPKPGELLKGKEELLLIE